MVEIGDADEERRADQLIGEPVVPLDAGFVVSEVAHADRDGEKPTIRQPAPQNRRLPFGTA